MSNDDDVAIRALCEVSDYQAAATEALEAYGPGVHSFLVSMLRSNTKADDVFSEVCEDLWRGLPTFEWRCTLRSWMFTLARNAAFSHARKAGHRANNNIPLSGIDDVVHKIRTQTAPYKQTAIKDRFRALRERLPEDEQAILILRVDKRLSWNEVSRVMTGEDKGPKELQKDTARIRKRFQLVKDKLRKWAIEDGLIAEAE